MSEVRFDAPWAQIERAAWHGKGVKQTGIHSSLPAVRKAYLLSLQVVMLVNVPLYEH